MDAIGKVSMRFPSMTERPFACRKTTPHAAKFPRPHPSARKSLPADQKTTIITLARQAFAR